MTAPMVDYADVKSGDVELWLIRCPPGFDYTQLHGKPAIPMQASGGITLRSVPSCETEGLIGAFPSLKKQRYMLGRPFTRQMVVTLPASAATASEVPPTTLPPVPQHRRLTLRNPYELPQVSSDPVPPSSTRKRSRNESETAEERAQRKAAAKAAKAAKAGHRG